MMKNKFLFVDGSNLYGGQYELFGPNNYLLFDEFIKQIEKLLKIRFKKIFFYASFSPLPLILNERNKKYLKNESQFYKSAKKINKLVFFKGYRSKTSGKEKEVDVKLAVDIVNYAHLNKYDELYLFSGDADFMHALKVVESRKKKIYILALENRIPNRFTFFYKTFVFDFGIGLKKIILEKQRINRILLDKRLLVGEIKK